MFHSRPLRLRDKKGFTLIEVLVAIALTAILLTSLYGTFFSLLNGAKGVEEGFDDYMQAGRFLDRFSREVRSAHYAKANALTVFKGEEAGGESAMTFSAFTYPEMKTGEPSGDLMTIRYYAKRTEGGYIIEREAGSSYTGDKFKAEATGEIKAFDLGFHNGKEWVRAWDASLEGGMPKAVKATLRLKNGAELSAIARPMTR